VKRWHSGFQDLKALQAKLQSLTEQRDASQS
jgi:hypothetical protein